MNKNIKYIIERFQNFNPAEYQDDDNNIIDPDNIKNIITSIRPANKQELRQIIKKRFKEQLNNDIIEPYLLDIDVSLISDFSTIFTESCNKLEKPVILDLSTWTTPRASAMNRMFKGCKTLIKLDISHFNTENVKGMFCMFSDCEMLTELDLSNFNTRKCTDMSHMFSGCASLTSLDLSNFETRKLHFMDAMFENCISLKTINMSNFAPRNMELGFNRVFKNCTSLISLDIHNINVDVTSTTETFYNCYSLQSLELGKFNYNKLKYYENMFYRVNSELIPNWYYKLK